MALLDLLAHSPALGGLEVAFNRVLKTNPNLHAQCIALNGKTIALHINELGAPLFFAPNAQGMQITSNQPSETIDTQITADMFALMRLAFESDAIPAAGQVRIEGDAETGQKFQRVLENLEFDWEEQLSKVTGDVIAHELGKGLRGLFAWGKTASQQFVDNTVDYLQFESGDIVSGPELDEFTTAVDDLRDDVSRLEARVKRLQAQSDN